MKGKKILVIAAVVVVVLVVAAVLIIPRLIDPEKYRDVLQEKATSALNGREVKLGKMSLDLWPGIGLEVDGIEVSDLEVKENPLLKADSIITRAAFFPLLSGRLEIKSIEINSPSIYLVRLSEDKWNISDLSGDTAEKPEEDKKPTGETTGEEGTSPLERLAIQGVYITDGFLRVEDRSEAKLAPLELSIDNLELTDILGDGPAGIELAAALADGAGSMSADGEVGPFIGGAGKLSADMSASLQDIDLPSILVWVPTESLPIKILSGKLSGDLSVQGGTGSPINTEADLRIAALKYTDPEDTWADSEASDVGLKTTASYEAEKSALKVGRSTLSLPAGAVAFSADYTRVSEESYILAANASSEALSIQPLLEVLPMLKGPVKDADVTARGPFSFDVSYDAAADGTAKAEVEADFTRATMLVPGAFDKPEGKAMMLRSGADLDKTKIKLTGTNLKLGPLDFKGGGDIQQDEVMSTDITLSSGPADTNQAIALFPALKDYDLGGTVTLALEVSGGLKKTESLTLKIAKCRQESEQAKFDLFGLVHLTKPIQVIFQLDSEYLDLDKVMKPSSENAPEKGPEKTATEKKGSSGEDSGISGIEVDGKVKMKKVRYSSVDITNLSAEPKLIKGVLSIPDLQLTAFNAPVNGPVKLDLSKEDIEGDVSINADGIPVHEVIKEFTKFPTVVTGNADGSLKLSFKGTEVKQLTNTTTGNGKVELEGGTLKGVDLVNGLLNEWAQSGPVKSLARQSLTPVVNEKVSEETSFEELATGINVKDGRVHFEEAVMDVTDGRLLMDGSVGLDKSVDLGGKLQLNKEETEAIMGEARNWIEKQTGGVIKGSALDVLLVDGRLVVPFRMSGTFPKPTLSMDSKAYSSVVDKNVKSQGAKDMLDKVVGEEERKKVEEDVKKKAEEALGEEGKKLLDSIMPK